MEENKHRIPNQLVLLRKRKYLSQKRVARIIGLRDATLLSRYEKGREAPPLKTAMKLAALYDVALPEIFRDLSRPARTQAFRPRTEDATNWRSASHDSPRGTS